MRVCHMCDSSLEGDYFRNMTVGLIKRGVKVTLVELGSGKAPTWLGTTPGAEYFSLGSDSLTSIPGAAKRLAGLMADHEIDILHAHLFRSGIVAVLSKRFRKNTVVALMRHHTSVVRMLGTRLHVRADRWMAEHADHVLTVSEAAREYMLRVDKVRRKDIEVIHLGFDFEKLSPDRDNRIKMRAEFGYSPDETVIGYVANFAPGKGHVQLLEAFESIRKAVPGARLWLAGRGELEDVAKASAAFESGAITFAGWRSDIPDCLNAMDIFVQPSLSEAFSQVLMEAMGVGLPVVATDVGGAREVIANAENGYLVEPGDPRSIAKAVIQLARDPSLRERIGRAARATVAEKFTAEIMVERHHQLYERWLAGQ